MSATELNQTYRIPEKSFPRLKEAIAKIGRKAVKLGFPEPTVTVDHIEEQELTGNQQGQIQKWLHIVIKGERAIIKGFDFVGSVQHLSQSKDNILRAIPGEEIPERFRSRRACDYCNHDRYRKDTFIIKHPPTGNYFQIGRTCLKDFFGGHDPHDVAAYAELLGTIEEYLRCSTQTYNVGTKPDYLKLEYYLWFVAYSIRNHGWVSKTSAYNDGGVPTAETALNYLIAHATQTKNVGITESDRRIAHEATSWAKKLSERPPEELNNYLHNIKVIAETGVVESKLMGYAASIIRAWEKDTGNASDGKERNRPQQPESQHFGTEGKRDQWPLYLEAVTETDSYYGTQFLHHFLDYRGRIAKWFSTSAHLPDRKHYMVKGTVKKHDEFRGQKQTILTRCNCEEIFDEAKIQALFSKDSPPEKPEQPPEEKQAEPKVEQPTFVPEEKKEEPKPEPKPEKKPDPNRSIDQRLGEKFSFMGGKK